jgi:hypothetical protein
MPAGLSTLVLLTGTALASPRFPAPPAPPPLASDALHVDELVKGDVHEAARATALVGELVTGLPPARKAPAAAALRELAVSDPFTRAALAVPFALQAAVRATPAEALPPDQRADWDGLVAGLDAHVALLEELGVDLVAPTGADPLAGTPPVARPGLRPGRDPVAQAAAFVAQVPELARQVGASEASARIDQLSDELEALTGVRRPCPRVAGSVMPGQAWDLGLHLGAWQRVLEQLAPAVDDPATRARLEAMVALLQSNGAARHATTVVHRL